MKANKKINLSKNPVYIPNQAKQSQADWNESLGASKEKDKEYKIHMQMSKRKKK